MVVTFVQKLLFEGRGQVVCVLAYYNEDPSSNPVTVYSFYSVRLFDFGWVIRTLHTYVDIFALSKWKSTPEDLSVNITLLNAQKWVVYDQAVYDHFSLALVSLRNPILDDLESEWSGNIYCSNSCKNFTFGQWLCGTVDNPVASDVNGHGFESSDRQLVLNN